MPNVGPEMSGFSMQQDDAPGAGPFTGRIVRWDDNKGFGWVEHEGQQAFAHIKDFPRGQRRPSQGDVVTYRLGADAQGRTCAKGLRLKSEWGWLGIPTWLSTGAMIWLAALLVLPLFTVEYLPVPKWLVPAWMGIASVVAWFYYKSDKARAGTTLSRIPESTLHLIDLLGGWPGAYLAQRRFRHKTKKASFRSVFHAIVILYQLVAIDVILGHALSRRIWQELGGVVMRYF